MPVSSVDRQWAAEQLVAAGVSSWGRTEHLVEVVAEARGYPGEVQRLIDDRKRFMATQPAAGNKPTVAEVVASMVAR